MPEICNCSIAFYLTVFSILRGIKNTENTFNLTLTWQRVYLAAELIK